MPSVCHASRVFALSLMLAAMALPALAQVALDALALDGVADRSWKHASFAFAFRQVVLGTCLDRLQSEAFAVESSEDNHRQVGGCRANVLQDLQPGGVRKGQVQERHVEAVLRQKLHRAVVAIDVRHLETRVCALAQHFAQQPRIGGADDG